MPAPDRHDPEPIIARLDAGTAAVLAEAGVGDRLRAGGASPCRVSPAEFAAFIREDRARFARIIDSTGIRQ